MRYTSSQWTTTGAVHIGHHHDSSGQNCQDAAALRIWETAKGKTIVAGVICDGCGGVHDDLKKIGLSGHSEVGANLISDMIVRHLAFDADKPISWLLESLFSSVKRFIDTALWTRNGVEDMVVALQQFYLTTINGFIMNDEEGYFFSAGDGCYQINDKFIDIDQNNNPKYIAYACCPMPEAFGIQNEMIPTEFTLQSFDPRQASKIMVASDGFTNHNPIKMDTWQAANAEILPEQLHGEQWGKKGLYGLKKWMNTRYVRGYFDDDCAIITAERIGQS